MIHNNDMVTYFRDLMLVEEQALKAARRLRIPKADKDRVVDTIVQKQYMLSQAVNLFTEKSSSGLRSKEI